MDFIEQLLAHTSVRHFSEKPVDTSTLERVILCAQHAPTSEYMQAYTILNITDAAIRRQIYERVTAQKPILEAPVFLVFCADVSRLIRAAHRHGQPVPESYLTGTETFLVASMDTAIAAQSAAVAAESLGLGCTYIGGIRNDLAAMCALLALPAGVYPVFGMVMGYPKADAAQRMVNRKPRLPLNVVFKENRYDDTGDEALLAEYDAAVQAYYRTRTGGKREDTWTEQMSEFVGRTHRPELKAVLAQQGFLLQ